MAALFHLRVLAADRAFYDGDVREPHRPDVSDGELGILAAPQQPDGRRGPRRPPVPGCRTGAVAAAAISGGLVKVEDGDVLVLADSVERPEEIDAERARRARGPGPEKPCSRSGAPRSTGAPRPTWPGPSTA